MKRFCGSLNLPRTFWDFSGEQMRTFKVTVIGTINRDTIVLPGGERRESFGGILYNVSALSGLGGECLEVYPVCNLGYDVYDQVTGALKNYANVRLDGVIKVRRKNNHALLLIDETNEREEILKNRVPALSFAQIKPFLQADAVLVNFISGFDVTLGTLRRIRKNTDALIFADVHSFTLGVRRDGRRFLRTPRRWREYLKLVDVVQCNLAEFGVLSGKQLRSAREVRDFGSYILGLGPKALLVTLGAEGAVMIYKQGKTRKLKECAGLKVRGFKDATGCGDIFTAGFLSCYLRAGSLHRSLDLANRVAAEKCKVSGVEGVAGVLAKFITTARR